VSARRLRSGQAMVETVLAVLIVTSVFLCLFKLSHALTGKILLEHAAMRVARARAVGYNDFMCLKAARIATIPVAGKRETPQEIISEPMTVNKYLQTLNAAYARGLLHYERWDDLSVQPGRGSDSVVALKTDWFDLKGEADAGSDYLLYMDDMGL